MSVQSTRVLLKGSTTGLALGMLIVALGCAAFASQGLHSGWRIVDWLIGIGLVSLPMLLVFLLLRLLLAVATRLLRLIGRHGSPRVASILTKTESGLRVIGHPLFVTTLTIIWLVWGSPDGGPLALYHSMFFFEIPIAAGALGGALLGAAAAAHSMGAPTRARRIAVTGLAAPGLAIVLAVGGWSAIAGLGDPVAQDDPGALAAIPALELPDPSQAGGYAVTVATYGSGTDARRTEFGSAVDWRTATVDASNALPSRTFPDDIYAKWFWGFDDTQLPINATVWYPTDAPGRLPVALIVHGNHDAGDYSDPGYAYLGYNLATHGIIAASVDENFLNGDSFFDYAGAEMGVRAWFLLRHLDQLRVFDGTTGNPLYGRVDAARVALIGHSRGGEAATLAAAMEQKQTAVLGMPATPAGFGIRAVVAIAPSDGMYHGPGAPASPRDIDYLVLEGARDADLPAYSGLMAYHRVDVSGGSDNLKSAVYIGRANHGRFNAVWDTGDAGPLSSWLLERGSLLSPDEQQRAAKTVIGAFLARSLLGETGYDAFFREPRVGRNWLPADVVESHWQTSGRITADGFSTFAARRLTSTGFDRPRATDVPLRDGTTQHDSAAYLTWADGATLSVPIDPGVTVDESGSVVFSMVPTLGATTMPDPLVTITGADGVSASIRLSEVAPARPLLPVRLWKLDGLGDRYLPSERVSYPAERFLQTYALPLEMFRESSPTVDIAHPASVSFRFEGSGSIYLDDVAFEPPVPPST